MRLTSTDRILIVSALCLQFMFVVGCLVEKVGNPHYPRQMKIVPATLYKIDSGSRTSESDPHDYKEVKLWEYQGADGEYYEFYQDLGKYTVLHLER